MGNFSEQQRIQTEVKEKNRTRREKLASYFFDLSKLTFAALVLGGISPLFSTNTFSVSWIGVVVGIYSTYIFAYFANRILKH